MRKLSSMVIVALLAWSAHAQSLAASHAGLVKGPFKTGPEVTRACLECHEDQAKDLMQTVH